MRVIIILLTLISLTMQAQPPVELAFNFGNHFFKSSTIYPRYNSGSRINAGIYTIQSENSWSTFSQLTPRVNSTLEWSIENLIAPITNVSFELKHLFRLKMNSFSLKTGLNRDRLGSSMMVYYYNYVSPSSNGTFKRTSDLLGINYADYYWGIPLILKLQRLIKNNDERTFSKAYFLLGYKLCIGHNRLTNPIVFPGEVETSVPGVNQPITFTSQYFSGKIANQIIIGVGREMVNLKSKRLKNDIPIKMELTYSYGFGNNPIYASEYTVSIGNTITYYGLAHRGTGWNIQLSIPVIQLFAKEDEKKEIGSRTP